MYIYYIVYLNYDGICQPITFRFSRNYIQCQKANTFSTITCKTPLNLPWY